MILENKFSHKVIVLLLSFGHFIGGVFPWEKQNFLLILQLVLSAIYVYFPSLMTGMADFHFFQVKLIFTFSAFNPVSCQTGLWNLPERSCGGMRPFLEVINLFPSFLFLTSQHALHNCRAPVQPGIAPEGGTNREWNEKASLGVRYKGV